MDSHKPTSRRCFVLRAGAMLGVGATAVSATPVTVLPARRCDRWADSDREAIRELHLAFTTSIEKRDFAAATELFHEQAQLELSGARASGRAAIARLFDDEYRRQGGAVIHSAYRQGAAQCKDTLSVSNDRQRAHAEFYVEAQVSTPLKGDSTLVQMARLQGQMACNDWVRGRFRGEYVRSEAGWRVLSLLFSALQ